MLNLTQPLFINGDYLYYLEHLYMNICFSINTVCLKLNILIYFVMSQNRFKNQIQISL